MWITFFILLIINIKKVPRENAGRNLYENQPM
jgi:hypothetical protein